MNILVLNLGSSSLKYKIINTDDEGVISQGSIEGIGLDTCNVTIDNSKANKVIKNHYEAIGEILSQIDSSIIDAIGHRVVHGGDVYCDSIIIDEDVILQIKKCFSLAPLHNPINLEGIKACKKLLPGKKQVAVFDTAFHQTMQKEAYLYAIPRYYFEKYKIRRYGFHGTSHRYVTEKVKSILGKESVNIISCHLGNGASIAAIKENKVIDTSMGFSPLEGLVMGTRCGDIDAQIINFIAKTENKSTEEVLDILNKRSGLIGLSGKSDMRDVQSDAHAGNIDAITAIDVYAHRILKYIGAYLAEIGKIDAIVFTAGVGQGAFYLREKICSRLAHFGIELDSEKNNQPWINELTQISTIDSSIKILVMPTNEELMIARDTKRLLRI